MRATRLIASVLAALVLGLAGVSISAEPTTTLVVSAAVSLSGPLTEIGAAFERENPGVKVAFNFGASGMLLQQLLGGAPADAFFPADVESIDKAGQMGLLADGSRRIFTANRLVLAVPAVRPSPVTSAASLKKSEVGRIAIGDPAFVPAGRYARKFLEEAGLLREVESKLVLGSSARQVLDYIARGEVDAGLVYATDALSRQGKVSVADELKGFSPALYPAAILKSSTNRALTEKFLAFTTGYAGKAALRRYGFVEP